MTAPCTRFKDEAIAKLAAGEALDPHFSTCPDCLRAAQAREQVLRRIDELAVQRRRLRWVTAGVAAVIGAGALLVLLRPTGHSRPRLTLAVLSRGGAAQRAAAARPGDLMRAVAETAGAQDFELRVYLDGRTLHFRCPPGCVQVDGRVSADVALPGPGVYQAVWLTASQAIPPPSGDLAADTDLAIHGGARSVLAEPITVR